VRGEVIEDDVQLAIGRLCVDDLLQE
jgi:hypothetical protein